MSKSDHLLDSEFWEIVGDVPKSRKKKHNDRSFSVFLDQLEENDAEIDEFSQNDDNEEVESPMHVKVEIRNDILEQIDEDDYYDSDLFENISDGKKQETQTEATSMETESNKSVNVDKEDSFTTQIAENQKMINHIMIPPELKLKHWLYRGRKLYAANDPHAATDAFIKAYALARIVRGSENWRTARCKIFMAKSYLYLMHYPVQAKLHSTQAIEDIKKEMMHSLTLMKKPQVQHSLTWGYLVLGESKILQNEFRESLAPLAKALFHCRAFEFLVKKVKKMKASMEMDNPIDLTVCIYKAQARSYEMLNDLLKSKEQLEEALSGLTEADVSMNGPVVPLMQQLGLLLLEYPGRITDDITAKQDIEKGYEWLTDALSVVQNINRPGSSIECEIRSQIVRYKVQYSNKFQYDADILWEINKLKIWSARLYGDLSMETRKLQDCAIKIYVQQEKYDEAMKELLGMMDLLVDAYGEYSSQASTCMRHMARICSLQNCPLDTLYYFERALVAEKVVYGPSSRRVQVLTLKVKDLLHQVPPSIKSKILRKHPELQQKPRFKSY